MSNTKLDNQATPESSAFSSVGGAVPTSPPLHEFDIARTQPKGRSALDMLQREAAPTSTPQITAEDAQEAYGYLSRLFLSLAPQCEPLPDLLGLATQIDNYIAGLPPAYLGGAVPTSPPHELYIKCPECGGSGAVFDSDDVEDNCPSDCNGNTGLKSSDEGTPIDAGELLLALRRVHMTARRALAFGRQATPPGVCGGGSPKRHQVRRWCRCERRQHEREDRWARPRDRDTVSGCHAAGTMDGM